MTSFRALGIASSLACLTVLILSTSCSDSDDDKSGPLTCANPGGAVSGTADSHCGGRATTIEMASCKAPGTTSLAPGLHLAHHDAGQEEDGGTGRDYGPTLSNDEGDDDECKYHVKWAPASDTQVCANGDVYFTVTVTTKVDGAPARNVPVRPDSFLNDTHPSVPRTTISSETSSPGVYRVGPVRFDAPGNWTVRFHFHDTCIDGEHSPHGHAAFYVSVP